MRVGVLSFQGAFLEHEEILSKCGVECTGVKEVDQLGEIDALVLPGGESTTIGRFLEKRELIKPVKEFAARGNPVMGTCAGMVLLAKNVENQGKTYLELMDITVKRNAFGRQKESFEAFLDIPEIGEEKFKGIFIRAPYITSLGLGVKELARFEDKVVGVRQENIIAAAFHPELGDDLRWHRYFVELIKNYKRK